jgi:hypothetical protein
MLGQYRTLMLSAIFRDHNANGRTNASGSVAKYNKMNAFNVNCFKKYQEMRLIDMGLLHRQWDLSV